MVDVVLALEAVQHAVRQFQADRVPAAVHVLGDVRSAAAKEDAVQARIQLRPAASALIAQAGEGLKNVNSIVRDKSIENKF